MGHAHIADTAVSTCKLISSGSNAGRASRTSHPLRVGAKDQHHCRLHAPALITDASRGRRSYATRPSTASNSNNANIAIVGGGLTGLTTAYFLAKRLPERSAKITIYEGSNRLGGWIKTDRIRMDLGGKKGMVNFERGPRAVPSLRNHDLRSDDLVLHELGLELGIPVTYAVPKPRYIFYPDHLVKLPMDDRDLFRLLREPWTWKAGPPLLSWYLKQALTPKMLEPVRRMPSSDISIAQWLREVFNSSAIGDYAASAIVHGTSGGDIDKISARTDLDEHFINYYVSKCLIGEPPGTTIMLDSEYKFHNELFKEKTTLQNLRDVDFIDKKGGLMTCGPQTMEALPKALIRALEKQPNVEIKLGEPVQNIRCSQGGVNKLEVTTPGKRNFPEEYDKVVYTLNGRELNRVTGGKVPSLADTHAVSIMTVNMWYPIEGLNPPGVGYLIPRAVSPEQNPERALGVFFDSDLDTASGDEIRGTKLFVLMGGHYYDSEVTPPSEEEAIRQAKNVVARSLGIPVDTPCFATARLAKDCIEQHYVGHARRMVTASEELEEAFDGRLAVAGGAYTRNGVLGALRAGYDSAWRTATDGFFKTGIGEPVIYNYMYWPNWPKKTNRHVVKHIPA